MTKAKTNKRYREQTSLHYYADLDAEQPHPLTDGLRDMERGL